MSRPVPPPRRSAPPPPPPESSIEVPTPTGIAARIASLQLDQIGRTPAELPQSKRASAIEKAPPPPPPRRSQPPALPSRAERDPHLAKLLSRPPPPPPVAKSQPPPPLPARSVSTPSLPPRRLPPRLPTPPPEPEYDPEPEYEEPEYEEPELEYAEEEQSDEGYHSQQESCIKCWDFTAVDAHAAQFPRHTVSSVAQLAYDLTAPFSSETEKARALFYWLHCNIAYDCDSFFSGNISASTADSTLQSGLAVCDGYAGLFTTLAEHAGLQAHKVTGHGKGFGYAALPPGEPCPPETSNHAWNCVLMDQEWRLIDSCWGAGALMGASYTQRFAPVWFISTPAEFGKRHFPTDSSYQLADEAGPVSWEEYILEPEGPMVYGDFDTQNFLRDLLQPATAEIHSGGWVTFHIFKQCEHMSREVQDNYVYFINAPDDTKTTLLVSAEGGWSANIYMPRGLTGDVSLNFVTKFDNRDAKGLDPQIWKNSLGRKAMAWQFLAKWRMV
ncbi:kyphoscoliosis peptidase [Mycena sanguinolenta]|nr:kyphoscoliosis peptidase [Mycena sanguinolenta]